MKKQKTTTCPKCNKTYAAKGQVSNAKAARGIECEDCRTGLTLEAREDIKRQASKAAFEAEMKLWEAEEASQKAWRGVKRTVKAVEAALNNAGISFEKHVARTGSTYISIEIDEKEIEIRVADHKQVAGGGFNELAQQRNGETDFDINPKNGRTAQDALNFVNAA